ncbi:MAG TPA: polyphosphate kinase 1 [Bryobacteraceae bacterium]|nr:polyphosphate kinase 1 [Bryobacteraceae bacterium]
MSRTIESQESLRDPKLYCNRELSLLAFQHRVLEEALDTAHPLLERIKFLAIFGSNMDEFFMVRVAAFQQQQQAGGNDLSLDGRTTVEQLATTRAEAGLLVERAYECWRGDLLPALAAEGIQVVDYTALSPEHRAYLANFFRASVFPVLTPLGYDPGRPFPHISSLSLNLAILLRDRAGVERFARIKIPDTIDQLIALPSTDPGVVRLVWLEQIIIANVGELFPGARILDCYAFRITRDAEVEIQELESDDLLETIEEAVWQRRFRNLVRLELNRDVPHSVLAILGEELEARPEQTVQVAGPLDFKRLLQLCALDRPRLKFRPFAPSTPAALQTQAKEDVFAAIRRESILLHHPFDSFQPVVDFLRLSALDPQVLAIKMTLYRVGRDSPVVKALLSAVQEGKQVSVLVELKARFDEESNIEWAKALEADGVHVVYGIVGLKVHSKVALVVRREADGIRKYVHLGTGNYNPATARIYTDLSLLTCDDGIGDDAVTLFNRLTGYSEQPVYSKLLVAPDSMRAELIRRIGREIEFAERGKPARIIAKMNGIDDPEIIRWLYQASQAGVKIDLLVRGICCLRPGIPGISENIRVRSILGRFLEHSRVFSFRNGGKTEILLGSADWMTRNLSRRIEILFPIEDRRLIRRLGEMLEMYLADNVGAREMRADCSYVRLRPASPNEAVEAQSTFLRSELPSAKA